MDEHCTHTFRKILSTHKWQSKELVTYWLRCRSCGHKWKVYYDCTKQKEIRQTKEVMPPSRRRLTDLEVRLVLLDPRSTPGGEGSGDDAPDDWVHPQWGVSGGSVAGYSTANQRTVAGGAQDWGARVPKVPALASRHLLV
jgi:hypothetical protein